MMTTALVVEDDPAEARLLREYLGRISLGFAHDHAGSLPDALTCLRHRNYDVIFLDLQIPGSNGVATLQAVRAAAPEAAVVVVTNMADETIGEQCINHGAQDYLIKQNVSAHELEWVVRNSRARKATEDALQRSEAEYRALVENALFGIARIQGGEIRKVNPALARLLGYRSSHELIGFRCADLFVSPEDYEALVKMEGDLVEDLEIQWRHQSGSTVLVRLNGHRITHEKSADALEVIVEEIGSRRILENQLRQAQKMESLGRLSGGIAHDMNNTLNVVLSNVDLILSGAPRGDEDAESLDEIRAAALRGADLIRKLLAFSRNEQLKCLPFDLNETTGSLGRAIERLLPDNIQVQTALHSRAVPVFGDPHAMYQIGLNLATNSSDAMPNGGLIEITVENAVLTEEFCEDNSGALPGRYGCMHFRDHGTGMAQEVLENAFEPFYTTKSEESGTGLGLAMIYGLCKQMGGYVKIDSVLGLGTTVSVFLPAATEPLMRISEAETGLAYRDLVSHSGERVLFVEDQTELRRGGERIFKRAGYAVDVACDGREALSMIEAGQTYDVIVSDVVMPNMSGVELAQALDEQGVTTPIVLTSGFSHEDVVELPIDGQTIFLRKPWSLVELLQAVKASLNQTTVV